MRVNRNRSAAAWCVLSALVWAGSLRVAAQTIPVRFGDSVSLAEATVRGGTLADRSTPDEPLWHLRRSDRGDRIELVLEPPAGTWDFSGYSRLEVSFRNTTRKAVSYDLRAENPNAYGHYDTSRSLGSIPPRNPATAVIHWTKRPVGGDFEPLKPFITGFTELNLHDGAADPGSVSRLVLRVEGLRPDEWLELTGIAAAGPTSPERPSFLPFVDMFGQYMHTDWPAKIRTVADFQARLADEKADLEGHSGIIGRGKYGGWSRGPRIRMTGRFYPVKYRDKWWFVDPEGFLFWSYGLSRVDLGSDFAPVTDRASWFYLLPHRQSKLGSFFDTRREPGSLHYGEEEFLAFSFAGANLLMKYGPEFTALATDTSHTRLRSWGFNTMGEDSAEGIRLKRRTPYIAYIDYSCPRFGRFPDIYDKSFRPALRARLAAERGGAADDPWCLGFVVDRAMGWGIRTDGAECGAAAYTADSKTPAKQELFRQVRERYGSIGLLNHAWGTRWDDWDGFLRCTDPPDLSNANVESDCAAFARQYADMYFSTVRRELGEIAPDSLYLGCRYAGFVDAGLLAIASRYCDVLTFGLDEAMPKQRLDRYIGKVDKPILIGEFIIGSDGMRTPLRRDGVISHDPRKRMERFEGFLQEAVRHPLVVGAHYGRYRDYPVPGDAAGNASLCGFVSVTDTPDPELVEASRRLASDFYKTRGGTPLR